MAVVQTGCEQISTPAIEETVKESTPESVSEIESEPATESESANKYDSAIVSYLGPEGTYTQEACGVFFEKEGTYTPYKTVSDAVEALINGESNYAVIPQENTIGGAVTDYVDIVITQKEVSVVGEVELPINQNLLVLPGAEAGNIEKVYSHKQGIAQGKDWLKENLPKAEIIEVSSTAEGARLVSAEGNASNAAIASAACAEVYGLEVLAAGIQNNDSNKTRFYVLSKDNPSMDKNERMAFVASGKAEGLPGLLAHLENAGAKLVTIHDRPRKTELGEYNYLIECSDLSYEDYEKLTGNHSFEFRYLGEFHVKL
jgi:prephenate dehydratase